MVDLVVLDVGPVCHIELLIHCESPLVSVIANAAAISLRTHALTVEGVALRLTIEQFLGFDSLGIGVRSYHTLAESASLVRH